MSWRRSGQRADAESARPAAVTADASCGRIYPVSAPASCIDGHTGRTHGTDTRDGHKRRTHGTRGTRVTRGHEKVFANAKPVEKRFAPSKRHTQPRAATHHAALRGRGNAFRCLHNHHCRTSFFTGSSSCRSTLLTGSSSQSVISIRWASGSSRCLCTIFIRRSRI